MNEQTKNRIVSLRRGGSSIRSIARQLGIPRYQVAKVLAEHECGRAEGEAASPLPRMKKKRASCLDEHQPTLASLVERYADITAVRALEELKKKGFAGGYNVVKRALRELRPGKRPEAVVRFETGPGVQAQMDYSTYTLDFTAEGRRRVHAFGYILGYSRRQYLRFVESQDFTTTIREHVRAFEHLGGVAATCLYDNMKVVVTGYDGDEPVYNTRFLAFATHYGFRPVACRPRRGQTKGKIERQFDFVEKNLLNARTFRSLEHLNEVARWWLEHVSDPRIHPKTKQSPRERHQEELPHLIPLPAHPYDTAQVLYRCVNTEGLVAYCQNRYSVPWRYIGSTLPVRITEEEIIIYGPQIEEIARHRLLPRQTTGETVRCQGHEPADDGEKKYQVLKERYAELGETAGRFFEGLIQRRRYGKDEAQKVLALLETYRREDLVAAIERAVQYGAYSRSAIERILAVMATPKTALDQMADQEARQLKSLLDAPPVTPRPGKEYDRLFEPRSGEDKEHETRKGESQGQSKEAKSDETEKGGSTTDEPSTGPAAADP
jgi:transposase